MAICNYCDREMTTAPGCLVEADEEKQALKIRFGSESRYRPADGYQPSERCHDCGVRLGGLHHPGCDVEECPSCGGQRWGCACQPRPSGGPAAGLRVLPVYRGWTIDWRCRQFRRVHKDHSVEFLDFDTGAGDELLVEFIQLGINLQPTEII